MAGEIVDAGKTTTLRNGGTANDSVLRTILYFFVMLWLRVVTGCHEAGAEMVCPLALSAGAYHGLGAGAPDWGTGGSTAERPTPQERKRRQARR